MQSEECEEQKNIKWEKKGEKKHKIPSYMHNMILISFAFTPFQWVLCSTFVHGELFSFVHEYGMRGAKARDFSMEKYNNFNIANIYKWQEQSAKLCTIR